MLILAGVSINAIVGDNGILKRARNATLLSKYAGYLESLDMELTAKIMGDDKFTREGVNVFGDKVKNYIPIIEDEDLGKFVIVSGKLCLLEDSNSTEGKIASSSGIIVDSDENNLEGLALESIIKNNIVNSKDKIGTELKSKTGNSTDWKIVSEINLTDGKLNKNYETGYYYIEQDTEVGEVGKLKNGYLVGYNDDGSLKGVINILTSQNYKYQYLDINSTLGVSDHLMLNMDVQGMKPDANGKFNIGEGVKLISVKTHEAAGTDWWKNNEVNEIQNHSECLEDGKFIFNGERYIEIPCNLAEKDKDGNLKYDFYNEGLTFEFYGNIQGYKSISESNMTALPIISPMNENFNGYSLTKPPKGIAISLFEEFPYSSTDFDTPGISWSWSLDANTVQSEWDWPPFRNNQVFELGSSVLNNDLYIALSIKKMEDVNGIERMYQTVFVNGERKGSTPISNEGWSYVNSWEIDRFTMGIACNNVSPQCAILKGNIYCCRMYSRGLSDEELQLNYNATKTYHDLTVNN